MAEDAEKGINELGKEKFKIWVASRYSSAGFMVTDKFAVMIGSKWNFVAVDNSGVHLVGKAINLDCQSENIHRGGVFNENNDFIRMLPQTLVTPNSNQQPFPPLGFAVTMLKDLPQFIAMLSTVAT